MALGPDGRPKPGWPYTVPGTLEWYECGTECYDYPRAPAIAPDGSAYDSFGSGIYLVRADGRPAPGWPYLLPERTHRIDCCLGDTGGYSSPNYRPLLTADGRLYLPRRDERDETEHVDLMCLLPDGTICDGWPVRFADGLENNCYFEDEDGNYHDGFWANEDGTMSVCLSDPDGDSDQVVSVRPDGTIID